MAWDFATDPAFEAQLAWMDAFVRARVWPLETVASELEQSDLDRLYAPIQAEVKERGLWAAHLPPELGGQGFGQVKLALMHEIIGTSPFGPEAFGCQAPDSGNSEILAIAGSAAQKERWLGPLLAGAIRSAFAMTEPEVAGSDPTLIKTRAREVDGGWVLDGHKWFVTNGSLADVFIVMAVTDPDAQAHRRASMLIVPADAEGVRVLRDVPSMDDPTAALGRAGNHAEVVFDGVPLDAGALLGGAGDGFKIAQLRLGPGRIHHAMRWLGVCRRAFDMLCERATYRTSHGGLLSEKQTIQNWIADCAADMHAARLMTLHAAWVIDTKGAAAARQEIGLIKFFGARVLHDVVDRALQAHGALGYSADLPLEEMYRMARAARILDGPDEVHRQSVARQILKRYAPPPDGVPTEHVPTRRLRAREQLGAALLATGEAS
ncbi:(R)-benzylsuccinyl-CoA dehydrogenase [Baekduia alba]|uniref:acyl-CoA dehydrogenase family protein n=1 Tax=Baekduia alba TaxID=2997333 RepID=UPI0023421138|nr:acyl-CoA dehydrogenase family protein [Baekduia alba]WCB91793.1 (R)-benzylsuccinyl-CoA dehydrogenase [Baekduia alba]